MKFKIINGPKREFDKRVPTENVITLSNLVRSLDPKETFLSDAYSDCYTLAIYSDEYSGVADFFIEGFLIYSLLFAKKFGYEEVLLHNPPAKILHQLQASQTELEISVVNYRYPKLNLGHLRAIKQDFDNIIYGQSNVKNELLASLYSMTNKGVHKPTVVMLYGPTGVGKTETAKFVSKVVNSKKKLFRKQLSMFHNENFMNYIFGDKSNSFAKDLLDRETNIILLDEFDKAHPMFYSAFYQLFDEGVYTDKFYELNLENTIIFCTSNYQSEKEIKKNLGAPIYSRFDNFIRFEGLSTDAKEAIIERVYEEELAKFNKNDQREIVELEIKNKLKSKIKSLNNAREIRKIMIQTMSYPLINKL
ncbi:AAA family ATPase [Sporosarcina limicola]|uniref:ATP-dependent Clp protease ATP-binding subunit ClpA n=1 Tax=Sporosarcina limicola TaxID=34101 RepID=A0A927RCL9_9BACL|nr:AAA family ATPase [Sporosarcina limicola]MBE1554505.1 ATP-dependent Clp protease ATP-binding subunit ClpA [Sporosarcina limicola]